jgi:hypothetical protein
MEIVMKALVTVPFVAGVIVAGVSGAAHAQAVIVDPDRVCLNDDGERVPCSPPAMNDDDDADIVVKPRGKADDPD